MKPRERKKPPSRKAARRKEAVQNLSPLLAVWRLGGLSTLGC
jgi:hypothetical protein